MNLKESFRYQNFLESMMGEAGSSLIERTHAQEISKKHLRNKANPEAQDIEETMDFGDFYKNDDVLAFMTMLVEERSKLTNAISKAKATISFDLDSAIETNKFRQIVASRIQYMLRFMPAKKVERGTDYKFNVEGNQVQYYYDIEVEYKDAFDRDAAKRVMRDMRSTSDKVSAEIDSALINTNVEYEPPFNVNDSFADVMAEFLNRAE